MKRIFITGPHGFLGKNLCHLLQKKGDFVHAFEGNIKDKVALEKCVKSLPPIDFCFHLAGLSSDSDCRKDAAEAQATNADAPKELAKILAKYHPGSTFVFPSTGQIYAPVKESDSGITLTESSPTAPINFYANTKFEAEKKLLEVSSEKDLKVIVLRLFNHTHKSQAPQFFLPSIYKQLLEDAHTVVTGDLELIRDIGAVQDLMNAFFAIVNSNYSKSYDIFNISSGTPKKLQNIVEILARKLNKHPKWEIDKGLIRQNEPKMVLSSSTKFQTEFNWIPHFAADEESLVNSFLNDLSV